MSGILIVDEWQLRGASAEIVSVLRANRAWDGLLPVNGWARVAQALDTRIPFDERVTHAMSLVRDIQRADLAARWLPRFDRLPEHEFRQEFYPAYRDHSVHTLKVWLLGLYLFETVSGLREPLVSVLRARSASDSDAVTLFRRWWTPAALWHDAGYPFEAEALATDAEVRLDLLKQVADALSADGFQDGLRSVGIDPSPANLAQIHRAGRHVPFVFESMVEFLENGDDGGVIDTLWRRLGLQVKDQDRSERFLDDLTMKAVTGRPPFHDHGTFGAILLLRGCSSVDNFLDELTKALGDSRFRNLASAIPNPAKAKLDEAYLEFLESRSLIDMAAEAIAYHNIDFRSVDRSTLANIFGPNGVRPIADLEHEPHLVFLAIADTLQNWDRPHYRPQPARQRPAVIGDHMLLQGYEGKIRIAIEGESDPVKRVRNLFGGWIGGVDEIFAAKAQFSRRGDIQSLEAAPTISVIDDSAAQLGQLRRDIAIASQRARDALVRNQPRALVEAAEILEPVLQRAGQVRTRLTQAHQAELDVALRGPELRAVERQAVVAIQPGTLLPIGCVQERIGGGGFGEVYRVLETKRGGSRMLALKVFHGFELDDVTKRFYFERGFRAMESLRYERRVVSVDRMLQVPFALSMDYVEGINLEQVAKERRDVHARLHMLHQVAETLASAHNKGIIHRDVKPANVLLDRAHEGEPVLTDFDLAHISGKTTRAAAHYASQLYGAPEQFNKRLDDWSRKPCVDVYGFGALAFHVLTFREPPLSGQFGEEQWALVRQSLEGMLPATVLHRLTRLLQDTTIPNPGSRLGNVEEMQQMEYVVRELAACRRVSAFTDDHRIPWLDWAREIAYTVTGETEHDNPQEFDSRSGGTTWRTELRDDAKTVILNCTLNREPRYEGVNYKGFTRSSARQVDRTLERFGKIDRAPRAMRHGQLGAAGSHMNIEVKQSEMTRSSAREIGELVSALARAVE